MLIVRLTGLAGAAVVALFLASPASALTMAECSTKYNAAKDAGKLDGQTWNQFRKAECGSDASAANTGKSTKKAKTSTAASGDSATGLTMAECSDKYQAAKSAGTLKGMKWNDFRKSECATGASAKTASARKSSGSSSASNDSGGRLTMAECSDKYQAAKGSNTLNGMKWNDFRKAECGASAADDDSVPSADEAKYSGDPQKASIKAPRGVKFPSAIARKYSGENPGKARMHTCLEQYYVNKDADSLNGLRWIQKGGGYYSLCNARLKG